MRRGTIAGVILFCLITFSPLSLFAAEKVSLTITPPLFQLNVKPGDFWSSSVRVINANNAPLTLYARVYGFIAEGEDGHGDFISISEGANGDDAMLARWINLQEKEIELSPGASGEIPFTISIPKSAPPGGQYAAILVGTAPPEFSSVGPAMLVSGSVSSLLFVRIDGDVREEGVIREFVTEESVYQSPRANFSVRFENLGNVHLRPQGDITIYNMWGKERGRILVNQQTDFGNVLPKSTRKFAFEWIGESNLFEAGRYRAVATLAYGRDARQNVSRSVTFWVIPTKETIAVFGSLIFGVWCLILLIRRYVRRALRLEMVRRGMHDGINGHDVSRLRDEKPLLRPEVLLRPLEIGIVDLRKTKEALEKTESKNKKLIARGLLRKYVLVLVFIPTALFLILWFFVYFKEVLVKERVFEINIQKESSSLAQSRAIV